MTKYYFISYISQSGARIINRHGLFYVVDASLNKICETIAENEGVEPDSVVIKCLKDLSKKEYEMLKGKES